MNKAVPRLKTAIAYLERDKPMERKDKDGNVTRTVEQDQARIAQELASAQARLNKLT